MGIKHAYQSGTANDGAKEVSSTRWNENHTIDSEVNLPLVGSPPTPAADTINIFGYKKAGRMLLGIKDPSVLRSVPLQPLLGTNAVAIFHAIGNSTTVTRLGYEEAITGTNTAANVATTNIHTRMRRIDRLVTTASTTAVAGQRTGTGQFTVGGDAAGLGGFFMVTRWGPATGVATTTHRGFCGMGPTTAPTDVQPSTLLNMCGMGWDAADTNIQFMHNDGTGTATKIDLGASFPVPTADRTNAYEIAMFSPPGTTQSVSYQITDLGTGAVATGTVTTDLPSTTTLMGHRVHMSVGGTSSVIGVAVMSVYIETDF